MAAIAHLLLRVGEVDTEYFRLQRCVHLFGSELRRTCRHRCERCCCANGMVATEPDWCSRIAKSAKSLSCQRQLQYSLQCVGILSASVCTLSGDSRTVSNPYIDTFNTGQGSCQSAFCLSLQTSCLIAGGIPSAFSLAGEGILVAKFVVQERQNKRTAAQGKHGPALTGLSNSLQPMQTIWSLRKVMCCRHILISKQPIFKDVSVAFGAASTFTTFHSGRHILLHWQNQMRKCVYSWKMSFRLHSGT